MGWDVIKVNHISIASVADLTILLVRIAFKWGAFYFTKRRIDLVKDCKFGVPNEN